MRRLRRPDPARSVSVVYSPEPRMLRLLRLALPGLLLAGALHAQPMSAEPAPENELEPIIVEGERDPLDVIGAHRERLPCIGDCEDEADEGSGFQRLLRDLAELSVYGPPEQKPEPVQSLEVINPIKARLDDKQP
jgi:hypothetical protein